MASDSRSPSRGFTLIELLVVMAIIAISAAASIPMGLNFIRHYKITGAAHALTAQVHRARSQAVKRNTSRGILLNFNYPAPGQYQFTSLDPSPVTGSWDGGVYPQNPGLFGPGDTLNYGMVPDPPSNIVDPDAAAGVQSPHGVPTGLPVDLGFDVGVRNALLFRSDGSVAAVNAGGSVGAPALEQAPNGVDWLITVRDIRTNLSRVIRVSPGGRVRLEDEF